MFRVRWVRRIKVTLEVLADREMTEKVPGRQEHNTLLHREKNFPMLLVRFVRRRITGVDRKGKGFGC
ncbi:MAG: hypothetical protein A2748_00885 [Candidatus Wildermuthbacteria bacterium RIFCSPHIGHO2_01_FULL_45_20]|nr:MAG: hypothetical protein A2748_00885 [Candidatus Wildermuthbacteria bacterium RIFCSPHIGHO2_01_FULL_45_20]